ncbi:acetoacetate decarboxylase family protein [Pyxidicoccus caerfyrddinensis]|uniref:acetoacetate decarboxylase family protein n=1 Tax=Pyxidicoccus caerfyrddinensis TaxID=2709663 RepID=UPI0013DAB97F|nr:acetoacetate decarboxylase family protein [Pyxidicoccus caerfyrddinensis]
MSANTLAAPQLVTNSRMLYSSWIPADPKAAAALLPKGLSPAANRALFMNQYVVDSADQTSGFGAYSLTYMGLDLEGHHAPDGVTPGRFFTHYLNSSQTVRDYVSERGVPASTGSTTLDLEDGKLVATTRVDGIPIIRTVARVGAQVASVARGQLMYVTQVRNRLMAGHYPYVGDIAAGFELLSLEFLAPDHPVYALRPESSLRKVEAWCWYSPKDSFVYPGGEYELKAK